MLKNAKDACGDRGPRDRHLHRARAPRALRRRRRHRRRSPRRSAPTRSRCSAASCSEIPKLTGAVVGAEIEGDPSYDLAKTGAADAGRVAGAAAKQAAKKGATKAKRQARQARKVPGVARAEGRVKGAVASAVGPADRRLRQAQGRRGRRQAARALAGRPRQGRHLRAQEREPHDGDRAGLRAAGQRAVARDTTSRRSRRSSRRSATPTTPSAKDVRTYERAHKDRAGVLDGDRARARQRLAGAQGAGRLAGGPQSAKTSFLPPHTGTGMTFHVSGGSHGRPPRNTLVPAMPKVIVIGGGVAGMSAAHELARERGFEVVVYEQRAVAGGKARSMDAIPGTGGRRALPGEHGFRFFPGFYRHLPDTMSRIPYAAPAARRASTTSSPRRRSRSRARARQERARRAGALPRLRRRLGGDHALRARRLATHLGIPLDDQVHFVELLSDLLSACEERRFGQYEHAELVGVLRRRAPLGRASRSSSPTG